jgi:uncharacterized membrane protein
VSRRVRLLIIASLALNLFLAGLIASALVLGEGGRGTDDRGRRGPRAFWAASEQLPAAKGEALRAMLRTHAEQSRPQVRQLRAAREAAADAMARQPYDPAAVSAALEQARNQELALRRSFDQAVIAHAAQLDPADRVVLAEALRRRRGDDRRGRRPPER